MSEAGLEISQKVTHVMMNEIVEDSSWDSNWELACNQCSAEKMEGHEVGDLLARCEHVCLCWGQCLR